MKKFIYTLFLIIIPYTCFSQDTLLWENFESGVDAADNTLSSGNWVFGVDAPTGSGVSGRGNRWAISSAILTGKSLGVISRRQNGVWDNNYNATNTANIVAKSPVIDASLYQGVNISFRWKAVGEAAVSGLPLYDYGQVGYSLTGNESDAVYFTTGGHPFFNDGYYETSSQNYSSINGIVTFTAVFSGLETVWLDGMQFYLHFKWVNDNSVAGALSFHVDNILVTGTYVSPLPVGLSRFEADCEGLYWETESEINNKGFHIECSDNLIEWRNIGFVPGKGNSNEKTYYEYATSTQGRLYYRLRQEDWDGKQEVFEPDAADCGGNNGLYVSGNSVYGNGQLRLVDMSGKTVAQGFQRIDLSFLAAGFYVAISEESHLKFFKP